jgi:phage terminase Nu1 subunit (DNA packaging protein)
MKEIVSRKDIAELLGITERAVTKLVDEGMPKRSRGKFSWRECVQWYIEKLKKKNNGRNTRIEKQNELLDLQIKEKQIDILEREGQSLFLEDTCRFLEEVFVSLRSHLLGMTAKISLKIDAERAAEIDNILQTEIRKGLNAASEKIAKMEEPKKKSKKELRKRRNK